MCTFHFRFALAPSASISHVHFPFSLALLTFTSCFNFLSPRLVFRSTSTITNLRLFSILQAIMPTPSQKKKPRRANDDDDTRDVAPTKSFKDRFYKISEPSAQTPPILHAQSGAISRPLPISTEVKVEPTNIEVKVETTNIEVKVERTNIEVKSEPTNIESMPRSQQPRTSSSREASTATSQASSNQRRPSRRRGKKNKNKNKQQSHQDDRPYQTNSLGIPILPADSTSASRVGIGLDPEVWNAFAANVGPAAATQATSLFHFMQRKHASKGDVEASSKKWKRGD